ncbi:aminotransferase class V-fold PLP-dependent enzyme [Flavobacteriaceae bacterium M23B6Z8]
MRDFKKEFPVLSQYTYLNTAYAGLMYESLMEWRQEQDFDYLIKGSLYRDQHHLFEDTVRKEVGEFFNCSHERVALAPNFSYAFNTIVNGLQHKKKVLLLQNDYPSVNNPFERGNFEIVYVEIGADMEEHIAEVVEKEKPDILALSIVQYINGIKIDLSFLKTLKKDFPSLLIIADGTQFCGTEEFDFDNSGVDILGASGYKWMLSGYGNAFMLFKQHAIETLYPTNFEHVHPSEKYSVYQTHLMNHLEPGHLDTLSFGSLLFSLRFLKSIGMESIALHHKTLGAQVRERLGEAGLLEDAVMKRKEHSTIYNIKGDDKLFSKLRSNYILCARRGDGIRVSFHLYNTEKDLNTLLLHLRK